MTCVFRSRWGAPVAANFVTLLESTVMERSVSIVAAIFLLSVGQVAFGQAPFVENLYVVGDWQVLNAADYQDIPASQKVVSVPSGTAVLTWSLTGRKSPYVGPTVQVRPAIGDTFPTEGQWMNFTEADPMSGVGPFGVSSGSWVTTVEQGTVTVRLQARTPCCTFETAFGRSITWTLVVFPEAVGGVPAVSAWGVIAMSLLVVVVGTLVCARRREARG